MAAIRKRDGYDWKFESEERSREVAKLNARIAELEAALNHLWDAAITVSHDGDSGCFVHEANWRKAMSVGPMKSKK